MSTDTDTEAGASQYREAHRTDEQLERLLETMHSMIDEAEHKTVGDGRVRNAESEKVKVAYMRATAQLAAQIRQIRQNRELRELHERLTVIEDRYGVV